MTKKVSVTFNIIVDDGLTHKQLREFIRDSMEQQIIYPVDGETYNLTSLQVNNIERGKQCN